MRRVLLPVLAVVIVVAVGIVQGNWTDRWGVDEKVEAAVRTLDSVPAEVGDWVSEDLSPVGREKLGLAGSLYRQATHPLNYPKVISRSFKLVDSAYFPAVTSAIKSTR